jgi:hypothetical protein
MKLLVLCQPQGLHNIRIRIRITKKKEFMMREKERNGIVAFMPAGGRLLTRRRLEPTPNARQECLHRIQK